MDDFQQIFQNFTPVLYRYLLSLCGDDDLAQELTSETFYQAYLHMGKFRGDCKPETWLCQIARNLYLDQLRKSRRLLPESDVEESLSSRQSPSPDMAETCIKKEDALSIYRILHCLDEPYKEVFTLRALGELSFREIGDIFGKQESWARVTYHRARMKILKELPDGSLP